MIGRGEERRHPRNVGQEIGGEPGGATVLDHRVPLSLSDPQIEALAVREGAALLAAPWERVLDVNGPDASGFLHNLLTQHVRDLEVGASVPAALATRKGHLVADLTVHRAGPNRFRLRMPSLVAREVRDVLEKHQIMEEVDFGWPYEDPDAFLLVGPRAALVLEAVGPRLAALGSSPVPVRELSNSDAVLLFEAAFRTPIEELCVHAGAVLVGWKAFDRRRIELGRAWFGIDADAERLVPEPGFDDRIHYDKGCYLGQEPLARLHFRGRPNWALVLLVGESCPGPLPGTDLLDESGDRIGWVTSVSPGDTDVVALGYLHRRFRESGVETVRDGEGRSFAWKQG